MPGFLLHVGATVLCPHGGQAQPVSPNPRVLVGKALTVTQPNPYSIVGCSLTPLQGGPCATAQWISAATRVLSGKQPLLLQDSRALCAPPAAQATVTTTQVKVRGS